MNIEWKPGNNEDYATCSVCVLRVYNKWTQGENLETMKTLLHVRSICVSGVYSKWTSSENLKTTTTLLQGEVFVFCGFTINWTQGGVFVYYGFTINECTVEN